MSAAAIVSTTRSDGSVHSSLVHAGVLDHPVTGQPVVGFVVQGGSLKLRLLRRSGRVNVVWRSAWSWAGAEGPVSLAGPDDVLDGFDAAALPGLLRDVFAAAGGTHDDWDEYDRVMAEEKRTAVLVDPARIVGN
jgi:hypothetical protein